LLFLPECRALRSLSRRHERCGATTVTVSMRAAHRAAASHHAERKAALPVVVCAQVPSHHAAARIVRGRSV